VVVELAGTVVVVVLVVVAGFFSFTVVQADSDTRAAVARHAMISLFIGIIVVWIINLQARAHNYAIGWSKAMGCNPTLYSSVRMDCRVTHDVQNIQRPAALGDENLRQRFDATEVALDTKRYLPKMAVVNQGAMLQHIPAG
jgi:hypothetical protein